MRRLSLSIAGILLAGSLSACSGGGSVLGFTQDPKPDHVIIKVSGPQNIARVLPGAGIALSAVAVNGSQNGMLRDNNFVWNAALTSGGSYAYNAAGQTKPCASIMLTQGGVTTPFTADFSIYITIDPVNEANIIFSPPTIIPPPFGGGTLTTNYPYCVAISAQAGHFDPKTSTFTRTGPPGSITVAVVDPLNPLP